MDITIKNYRCFPDTQPARITIQSGMTALVGTNNSGKSSLLKLFYEFRPLWTLLARDLNPLQQALRGVWKSFDMGPSVLDRAEIFSALTDRDLRIEFDLDCAPQNLEGDSKSPAERVVLIMKRAVMYGAQPQPPVAG